MIAGRFCALLTFALGCLPLWAADPLNESFKNPPQEARPQAWWHWMYGNIAREGITRDLELMKTLGIGGVTQFHNAWTTSDRRRPATPRGPVRFMSAEYRELVKYAVEECHRLNLTMGLQICDGFSQTGGPWVNAGEGMRVLQCEVVDASGGRDFSCRAPEDTIRVLAYPRGSHVPEPRMIRPGRDKLPDADSTTPLESRRCVDITSRLQKDGTLRWSPPDGDWIVFVFFHRLHPATNHPASPEGHGLECNKLDSAAVDIVYDHVVGPLIQDAGDLAGTTLRHVLIDSWECGYQSWTADFLAEFRKRRGYDATPYLPALASIPVDGVERSDRFLCDFRVTLDDLLAEEYYGHVRDRLHEDGLQLHAEPLYGGTGMFGNPIRLGGVCDVPMNEIWMKRQFPGQRAFTGYAAASGHVYGKRIVADESFTVGGGNGDFSFVPADMKTRADFVLCRGTTRFVLHTSTHQPDDRKPGWTHGWNGVNFHRGNTWWPYAKGFVQYLARCSHMLQQGLFVADVCRYVGQEDTYSRGYGELPLAELPEGYRADHCDTEVLLERMDVKDGRIVLPDGMSYAVLLLADKDTMAPEVLRKLTALVEKGATVIGPKPRTAPGLTDYPECDRRVRDLADALWGQCDGETVTQSRFGKGRVVWGKPLSGLLQEMKLPPDFAYQATPANRVNFIHRRLPSADVYFASTDGEACMADCWFRVAGKQPELFDPMTGDVSSLAVYEERDGRTRIPLRFEARGSKIIVFRKPSGDPIVKLKHRGLTVFAGGRPLAADFARLPVRFRQNADGSSTVDVRGETGEIEWTLSSGRKGKVPATTLPRPVELPGSWTVTFEPGRGAPARIEMDELASWTDHPDPGVRYFSGVGTYVKTFPVNDDFLRQDGRLLLELGQVKELAEVQVNGTAAGVLWRAPFEIDITDFVRPGRNVLRIKVINTWVNRLIGDKNVPVEERVCQIVSPDPKWYTAESALPPSGLMGPVLLKPYQVRRLPMDVESGAK